MAYASGMELNDRMKSEHDSQVREVTDKNGNTSTAYSDSPLKARNPKTHSQTPELTMSRNSFASPPPSVFFRMLSFHGLLSR